MLQELQEVNTCSWRQSAAPDKVSRKSMGRAGEAGSPGIRCHRPRRRAVKVRLREPECSAALNCFSRVQLYATLWTVARQAPLSMKVSRQEHWSGLPCSSPGDLPYPGIEPTSPLSPASMLRLGVSKSMYLLFKNGVSVSYKPLIPSYKPHWFSCQSEERKREKQKFPSLVHVILFLFIQTQLLSVKRKTQEGLKSFFSQETSAI